MYEPLSDSLRKIARGTGIVLIGTFVALLLGFAIRLILARYGSEADYGIYSLALVVFTFVTVLACLGLNEGTTRYVAFFRGKEALGKVRGTVAFSLQLAIVASVIISAALFFGAEAIASNIFHTPDSALALKIFACGVPFLTLIHVLAATFRGFDRAEPYSYFYLILLNVLFVLLLLAVVMFSLPFIAVFYAYVIALLLTLVALATYTAKKLPPLVKFSGEKVDSSIRKELLLFSLPVLGSGVISVVIVWAATLILGYFKNPAIVGLYNAAYPLGEFIATPLAALMLIYTPVATGLYSQNLMTELRRNYTILTKWIVSLTLPLFLVLCLFPEAVLNLTFGSAYVAAAPALRILSLGFIIRNLLGPNANTLLAVGKSRFVMWATLITAIISVLICIVLIPPLGIVGAAIAFAVSITVGSIIMSVRVYLLCQAQPLSKNLLKPLIASVALACLFQITIGNFITVSLWMLPLLFILYYGIYGIATVLTRSFDREDIAMLLEIEGRSKINLAPVKKILKRFVKL
jgi:O-antigen/teichoic acid export membrane protein